MKYQYSLFDLSDFEKRKLPSQNDFESMNENLLIQFQKIITDAFIRMNEEHLSHIEPSFRNKNLNATLINGFVTGKLSELYPERCSTTTGSRFRFKGYGNEWIYIKKLNDKKRPSHVKTLGSTVIENQLSEHGTNDLVPNIFLGYTANDTMTEETGVYAVCMDGDEIRWVTDIFSFIRNKDKQSQVQIKSEPVSAHIKEGLVSIKKKAI